MVRSHRYRRGAGLAQRVFADLTGRLAGQRSNEDVLAGHLEAGQRSAAVRIEQGGQVAGRVTLALHDRDDAFAELVVGYPDHRGVVDGRVGQQHRLDLRGVDVDATGDDQVLRPPGEEQVPGLIQVPVPHRAGAGPDRLR